MAHRNLHQSPFLGHRCSRSYVHMSKKNSVGRTNLLSVCCLASLFLTIEGPFYSMFSFISSFIFESLKSASFCWKISDCRLFDCLRVSCICLFCFRYSLKTFMRLCLTWKILLWCVICPSSGGHSQTEDFCLGGNILLFFWLFPLLNSFSPLL